MAEATNLRQANSRAFSEGLVAEKELTMGTDDQGRQQISGHITIKTDDVNFVRYSVMAREKTNAGGSNPAYEGLVTVMNDYRSIADVGEEGADRVRVNGQLAPFTTQQGADTMGYRASFFTRVTDNYDPHAEFEVELFIQAIVPETNTEGEETGRMLVKGWMPTYNGIEPVELVAEGEIASQVESIFEPGQTATFYGDIINSRVTKVTEIPVAIGKPKQRRETTYKNELVITGATEPYDEDAEVPSQKPYDKNAIKQAIQDRKDRLEERRNRAAAPQRANTRPQTRTSGRTMNW